MTTIIITLFTIFCSVFKWTRHFLSRGPSHFYANLFNPGISRLNFSAPFFSPPFFFAKCPAYSAYPFEVRRKILSYSGSAMKLLNKKPIMLTISTFTVCRRVDFIAAISWTCPVFIQTSKFKELETTAFLFDLPRLVKMLE